MEFNTRAANSSNNKSTGWNSTGGDRTSSAGAGDDSAVIGGKSASPNIISTGGTTSKTQSKRTRKGVTFSSGGATTANANAGRSAFGLHNSPVPVNGSVVSMPIVSVLDAGSIGTAAATAAGDCESGEYANGGDDDEFKRTGDTRTKSSSARDVGIGLNDCGLTTPSDGGSRLVAAPPMSAATVRIQCAGGVTTSPNSNISDNQLNDNINNVNIVEDKTKSNGTISNGSVGSGPLTPPTTTNADNLTRGQVKIASGNREQDYNVTKMGVKSRAANQMSVAGSDYNDFVNYLYDSGSDENQATAVTPLLSTVQDGAEFCPKSIIVKSPSAVNIQGKHSKSLKPRLSLQPSEENGEGSRGVRDFKPELHVQFVGNQPKNDIRTSSLRDLHVATAHSCTEDCELNCTKKLVCVSSQSFNSFSGSEGGDGGGGGASTSVGSSSSTTSSSSSNENSSEEGHFAEARPPDGGWGWVVVFASFMINLFSDGITFSFGVIYVEFLSYFGEGKAKTAWIGSLFMAMPLLSGPIASFLTDRYGCRNVTVAGSIMASIGFILSAFATSMEMLYVTFGILAGFGLSLCYVAAIVIVAYYFDKRRSFATGLSVCGSGIGTFIFAPLIQVLIEEYGWRGSVLILAGVFLNMGLCGLLMRDLEWTTYSRKKKNEKRSRKQKGKSEESNKARNTASDSLSLSTNTAGTAVNWNVIAAAGVGEVGGGLAQEGGTANATAAAIQGGGFGHVSDCISPPSATDHRLFSSLIVLPTFLKNGEKVPHEVLELLSTHRNFVLMNSYASMLHSRSFSEPIANDSNQEVVALEPPPPTTTTTTTENESVLNEIIRRNKLGHHNRRHHNRGLPMNRSHNDAFLNDMRMHRHSLTYRGAMLNINRYRLRASSCPDIYRNSMTTIAKEKNQLHQGWEDFRKLVVEILDLSPLLDVRFLLFAISNFLLYTWYDVPYVYIADYAISLNVSEKSASLILSIIGIVNMVGEIFLGWIGDKKNINVTLVYALCMILCGISVTVVPLFVTYEAIGTLSGLFGFFIAANYSLQSIILVQLITLERFTNAYGLLLLVQGVANLIGPPLAGYIRDVTGDYGISFYAAGVFIVISGLLLTILPAVDYYKKYVAASRQKGEQKVSPKVRDPEGEPLEKV